MIGAQPGASSKGLVDAVQDAILPKQGTRRERNDVCCVRSPRVCGTKHHPGEQPWYKDPDSESESNVKCPCQRGKQSKAGGVR